MTLKRLSKRIRNRIYLVKKKKDSVVLPATKLFARLNVRPDILTGLSFLFGIASVYFLFKNHYLFVLFIFLNWLFDLFDGALARYTKKSSGYGVNLDKYSDSLIGMLLLGKVMFVFNLFWLKLVFFLFILQYVLDIMSKNKKGVLSTRTGIAFFYIFHVYLLGTFILGIYYLCVCIFKLATLNEEF